MYVRVWQQCEQAYAGFNRRWEQGVARMFDRGRSRIMRKATPLQVAQCRRDHIRLPAKLNAQMFERVRRSRCAFRPKDGL